LNNYDTAAIRYYQVVKNMTDKQNDKYIFYTKIAWTIYTLMTIALIVVLVLFVAEDN